ncbi:Protein of unknown function DUF1998 [Flexistipes sinusarabici DSM 4947]|uniref:DEAD/DEAH box helicase n=1 Tax=Flexistipes sinusarabici (strain ATCC 49648 / DSM 4947 / MAS 10) TaxID=717231 RepID=F8E6G6_FLESM|nr:DEAD/DEAH box helicase [Flexistipes sinusarabici]AEI14803.1 Protein of unknown function DUF1998 [Flexistipes sinusarabici DSM 4947]
MIDNVIRYIKNGKFSSNLVFEREIPPKPPALVDYKENVESLLLHSALEKFGIKSLYSHQADAYQAIKSGRDTLITTPAASGKTLCYNLPIMEDMINNPSVKALYLFPIKALGYDQKKAFETLAEQIPLGEKLTAEIVDGDTGKQNRRKILKTPPNVIISNLDIIHYSMLPGISEWRNFLDNLKYVVIDEIHTYKGIFGTQAYNLLQRFLRLVPNVQFVCASATIGNPVDLVENFTGRKFYHINKNGAERGKKNVLIFNPDIPESALAQYLLKINLDSGVKTICFTKSRKQTEKIYAKLVAGDPSRKNVVSSYRAGFLPEERRKIEQAFHKDTLKAVVATSAIEMGIDVGGVDSTILVGYPGSLMSLWQRAGRSGRSSKDSLICLITSKDALDQYYAKNPEELFTDKYEVVTIDRENTNINSKHILCAANEKPVGKNERYYDIMKNDIEKLASEGRLFTDKDGLKYVSLERYPHKNVDFRMAGDTYTLVCNGIVIGTNSGRRLYTEHFENAVYLHRGDYFIVKRVDHNKKEIYLDPFRGNYYTMPKINKETMILSKEMDSDDKNIHAGFCNLQVSEQLTGYDKISGKTGEKLQTIDLEKEPVQFETKGFYLIVTEKAREKVEENNFNFMGSIHALEHSLIAMAPSFVLCDRSDIAGISYPLHPQLESSAVFIYDSYAGGAGICSRVFEIIRPLLERTLKMIKSCDCEEGCPSCIYSPKCGSGNYPLDKKGAEFLIEHLLQENSLNSRKGKIREIPANAKRISEKDDDVFVFDVETKYSADEVGGWKNADKMGISALVAYSMVHEKYYIYEENDIGDFIKKLAAAKAVIGFNIINFDFKVISGYAKDTPEDFNRILKTVIKIDLLQDIRNITGRRFSLDNLAQATINAQKSADGLQALKWYKEGQIKKIIDYCKIDVDVTRDLFLYGINHNKIYAAVNELIVQIPVNWKHYHRLYLSQHTTR